MHPANLEPLVAQPSGEAPLMPVFRLAPRQLEAEMASGKLVRAARHGRARVFARYFRMWSELVERARGSRVLRDPATL